MYLIIKTKAAVSPVIKVNVMLKSKGMKIKVDIFLFTWSGKILLTRNSNTIYTSVVIAKLYLLLRKQTKEIHIEAL